MKTTQKITAAAVTVLAAASILTVPSTAQAAEDGAYRRFVGNGYGPTTQSAYSAAEQALYTAIRNYEQSSGEFCDSPGNRNVTYGTSGSRKKVTIRARAYCELP